MATRKSSLDQAADSLLATINAEDSLATEAAPPPETTRRNGLQPQPPKRSVSTRPNRKRKLDEAFDNSDFDFLAETVRQGKRVKVPHNSSRAFDLEDMQSNLNHMKPMNSRHVSRKTPQPGQSLGEATEAYCLDGQEAKRLLQSTYRIDAPVFISNGAPQILDPESELRPLEQILDWLPDPDEHHTFENKKAVQAWPATTKEVPVSKIRERFIDHRKPMRFPWNFPEIPFPMPAETPDFLRHPRCNLLNDIIRFVEDINLENVCNQTCKNQGPTADECPKHFQTPEEALEFRRVVRQWLGTVMMAEAGAYTSEHSDTPGFGTLISCYEGEIGFGWKLTTSYQKKQQEKERRRKKKKISTNESWLFKVLRPGDAVYMGPGTRHVVFRQPYGTQTLATAIRVLRYCDVVEWLKALDVECDEEIVNGHDPVYFGRIVRALVLGTRYLIERAQEVGQMEKFGGQAIIEEAESMLHAIEEKAKRIAKTKGDEMFAGRYAVF